MTFEEIKDFIQNTKSQYIFFDWYSEEMIESITDYLKELEKDKKEYSYTKEELETVFNENNIEFKDSRQDSDEFWVVCYFKDQDIYIKIKGEYDSYGEGEHAYNRGIYLVYPIEIMTTIYQ